MRIIAGQAKGTRLGGLKGQTVRPTLDRVRESVFSRIMPDLPGARFLDLFAGTGANGLEALSRGAEFTVFVESNDKVQKLIRENIDACRFSGERWRLLELDAVHALKQLDEEGLKFDFVYVDPPFDSGLYEPALVQLAQSSLLTKESVVIVEHASKQSLNDNYDRLTCSDTRKMGDTCIAWYQL